jgi:hypothetical protein
LFGKSGECFGVVTPYITRFGLLKDMRQEHSELAVVSEGDVFFDEDY